MATISYCRICEELVVDEDELPIVGLYCSKKCEKLFEKYGLTEGRKEYKKRGKDNEHSVKNLPAESIPENTESDVILKKKRSDISNGNGDDNSSYVVKNTPSFYTVFNKKNKHSSEFENSPDDQKKKNDSKHKSKDYEGSLEYFRKRSDIEHLKKEDKNDPEDDQKRDSLEHYRKQNEPEDDQKRDSSEYFRKQNEPEHSRRENKNDPEVDHSKPNKKKEDNKGPKDDKKRNSDNPTVENQTTTAQPLYPDLKSNKPPLKDFEYLDINEPPPSYDTLYPNPPPQTLTVPEKPLPPEPIKTTSSTTCNKAKPPVIPPKVPPKVPIPTLNKNFTPSTYPHNSNQFTSSNSYQQYQQYQQYNDTFLQEQATLPSNVYPPPFYKTRFNTNNRS